ncbi:MAG TPA: winged helix-turn-helix transcriptional regulator [Candidatus Thermoplasmatota archaeon]|jgi:predicted transcriptional regulator|nr:winged helix-turn-helix transcriptional regulator [Candidatus Thermoplasmatota archaeon]
MTGSPLRSAILGFVERYPGVHVREVERQLGLSSKLAAYHVEALRDEGRIDVLRERGYTRLVARATARRLSQAEVAFICLMRRPPALHLVLLLLQEPELPQGELARRLRLAKASASYHLAALGEAGVVRGRSEGRQRLYRLSDPAWARRTLARFEPVPGDLDAFSAVWDDLLR